MMYDAFHSFEISHFGAVLGFILKIRFIHLYLN